MSKILGRTPAAPAATVQAAPAAQAGTAPSTSSVQETTAAASPATPAPSSAASVPPGPPVDVAAVLDALNDKVTQELDWKHSIVDLMKLISLDSSLAARKELAKELHYSGDMSDSASMNIWLHKQIMMNLAANGGKLPDDLKNLI